MTTITTTAGRWWHADEIRLLKVDTPEVLPDGEYYALSCCNFTLVGNQWLWSDGTVDKVLENTGSYVRRKDWRGDHHYADGKLVADDGNEWEWTKPPYYAVLGQGSCRPREDWYHFCGIIDRKKFYDLVKFDKADTVSYGGGCYVGGPDRGDVFAPMLGEGNKHMLLKRGFRKGFGMNGTGSGMELVEEFALECIIPRAQGGFSKSKGSSSISKTMAQPTTAAGATKAAKATKAAAKPAVAGGLHADGSEFVNADTLEFLPDGGYHSVRPIRALDDFTIFGNQWTWSDGGVDEIVDKTGSYVRRKGWRGYHHYADGKLVADYGHEWEWWKVSYYTVLGQGTCRPDEDP